MIRLYYYLYTYFIGTPCRTQVMEAILDGAPLNKQVAQVAHDYAMGYSLEDTARVNRITREQARQYLLKAVRV